MPGDRRVGASHAHWLVMHGARSAMLVARDVWPAWLIVSILVLYGFGWALPDGRYLDGSFHADENATVRAIGRISFPSFKTDYLSWGTALFYEIHALKVVASWVGGVDFDDRAMFVLGRGLVYAYALGVVTVLYLLARDLFGRGTAVLAALLLAVSPGFVISSHYLKVDVPMTFWLLLACLLACRLVAGTSSRVWALGLATGLAASTKYGAALFVVPGAVAVAIAPIRDRARAMAVFAGLVAVGFLAGTPYALLDPGGLYEALRVDVELRDPDPFILEGPLPPVDYAVNVLPYALTVPVLLLAVAGLVLAVRRHARPLLPVLLFLVLYAGLLSVDRAPYVRATAPVLPFAALFAAYALTRLWGRRALRFAAIAGSAAVVGYAFTFSLAYVQAFGAVDPRVRAAMWIEEQVPRDAVIATSSAHYLELPKLWMIGRRGTEVAFDPGALESLEPDYLIVSDMHEAVGRHPSEERFFAHVRSRFCEAARFENSQRLGGIDAKPGERRLSYDSLLPNPRVTILARREPGSPCRPSAAQSAP